MVNVNDLVGVPYLDGGRDPKEGLDCWGLVLEIYKRQKIDLPDYPISAFDTLKIARRMEKELVTYCKRLDKPETGCIIAIHLDGAKWTNHTGVYLGGGEFIHAYKNAVVIDRLRHWGPLIEGYYTLKGKTL